VTGLVLPLPEPPAEDVADLNAQLLIAQHELAGARVRRERIRDLMERGPAIGTGEQMRARVLNRIREFEVIAWSEELDALRQRARQLGLQP
jgi:hypothetical protein